MVGVGVAITGVLCGGAGGGKEDVVVVGELGWASDTDMLFIMLEIRSADSTGAGGYIGCRY